MSDFLDNLKNGVNEGNFNSDAAKKILEINKLADSKLGNGTAEELEKIIESIDKRVELSENDENVKLKTEEEIIEINSEYETKMNVMKKQDMINYQLATLIEIDDIIDRNIADMFDLIKNLENKFESELKDNDPMILDLNEMIKKLKTKYK